MHTIPMSSGSVTHSWMKWGFFIARLTPMAQEQFAGPEYFTDFDPKAFAEKIKKEAALRQQNETNALDEADSPQQQ